MLVSNFAEMALSKIIISSIILKRDVKAQHKLSTASGVTEHKRPSQKD